MDDGSSAGVASNGGDGAPAVMAVGPGSLPSRRPAKPRVDHAVEEKALALVHTGHVDEAVKILMRAYGAPITAYALRMLRESEAAYDVRQQVFLEAFQGISKFKGQSSVWSWLCGIACHRCLDELRRNRRSGSFEDVDDLDGVMGQIDPAMDADQIAERRALERCLAKLPAPMRSQVLMRCFLGLSYAEIAEIVGASHSTVQVRISRILPRLRRCLREGGIVR